MTDQRLWVTGYQLSGRRDILVTQHLSYDNEVLFSFDEHHIAYPVSLETLQDYRSSAANVSFYSISNPF